MMVAMLSDDLILRFDIAAPREWVHAAPAVAPRAARWPPS
jgi:hypothetical protein